MQETRELDMQETQGQPTYRTCNAQPYPQFLCLFMYTLSSLCLSNIINITREITTSQGDQPRLMTSTLFVRRTEATATINPTEFRLWLARTTHSTSTGTAPLSFLDTPAVFFGTPITSFQPPLVFVEWMGWTDEMSLDVPQFPQRPLTAVLTYNICTYTQK